MKMLLLLLFLAFSTVTISAQVKFISSDLNDIRQLADSIALNAKREFVFQKEGKALNSADHYVVLYKEKDNEENRMMVAFRIRMIGENDALEIEGIPEYRFEQVAGKFLDLFPFWNKYVNPKADAEVITTSRLEKDEVIIDGDRFVLKNANTIWEIRRFDKIEYN